MHGAAHADRLTQRVHLIQPDYIGDSAGAGVIADDDHHHQGIEQLNLKPGRRC